MDSSATSVNEWIPLNSTWSGLDTAKNMAKVHQNSPIKIMSGKGDIGQIMRVSEMYKMKIATKLILKNHLKSARRDNKKRWQLHFELQTAEKEGKNIVLEQR